METTQHAYDAATTPEDLDTSDDGGGYEVDYDICLPASSSNGTGTNHAPRFQRGSWASEKPDFTDEQAEWLRLAQYWSGLGFKTLPLRYRTKEPAIRNGVSDAVLADERKLWSWCKRSSEGLPNIAVATGDGHVAIDLDLKTLPDGTVVDGEQSLKDELDARGLTLPDTLTQRTPRGGLHRVYRLPEGHEPVDNARGIVPGVDLRGHQGYIAVVPSVVTIEGVVTDGPYSILDNGPIAEISNEVLDLLEELRAKSNEGRSFGGGGKRDLGARHSEKDFESFVERLKREDSERESGMTGSSGSYAI